MEAEETKALRKELEETKKALQEIQNFPGVKDLLKKMGNGKSSACIAKIHNDTNLIMMCMKKPMKIKKKGWWRHWTAGAIERAAFGSTWIASPRRRRRPRC